MKKIAILASLGLLAYVIGQLLAYGSFRIVSGVADAAAEVDSRISQEDLERTKSTLQQVDFLRRGVHELSAQDTDFRSVGHAQQEAVLMAFRLRIAAFESAQGRLPQSSKEVLDWVASIGDTGMAPLRECTIEKVENNARFLICDPSISVSRLKLREVTRQADFRMERFYEIGDGVILSIPSDATSSRYPSSIPKPTPR